MNLNGTHLAQKLPRRRFPIKGSTLLLLALVAGGTGCFRATGISRPTALSSEIPATGGDRIKGNKAEAGPGDYFLGNDFLALAVDGAPFGGRDALAGAASGGSIVDISHVSLDTSFKRVSMPGDSLERLTPVVNQDPQLPLVFDEIKPGGEGEAVLNMTGGVYDPDHKLLGAAWDAQNRVIGLKVSHSISLDKADRFFVLSTTLTNTGSTALPIRNIGDHLSQSGGGGFRPVIPATKTQDGTLLTDWGVDFPGTDPSQPLTASVKAPMVGFMAAEPAGQTEDSHASVGLLPLDTDEFLVAADTQKAFQEVKPRYAQRVVAGSLPVASLGAGQSLTHKRRLYVEGGTSQAGSRPASLNGVFNQMTVDRAGIRGTDIGIVTYSTFGTASPRGPLQTEIRWERNLGGANWVLERVEWLEPQENLSTRGGGVNSLLPIGTYRVTVQNWDWDREEKRTGTFDKLTNVANTDRPDLPTAVLIEKGKQFFVNESLAPERDLILSSNGTPSTNLMTPHAFGSRAADGAATVFQPLRITFEGLGGAPDPFSQRLRSLGGAFDPTVKAKAITGINYGAYLFQGGNGAFATAMKAGSNAVGHFPTGTYRAYSTRGPLSRLDTVDIEAFDGQTHTAHEFTIFPAPLPTGWTALDLPGPTQATGGGMLPGEQLASALAEGVSVVGRREMDRHLDAKGLRDDFRMEFQLFGTPDTDRVAVGEDPIIIEARSSKLVGFGEVTALSTPAPTPNRAGGARDPKGWNLADFLAQAEGAYNIVHRPRGLTDGLFTLKNFDRTVPLGTGVNTWWSTQGAQSLGKTNGGFDALELLRAEGCDPANPTPWFNEFLAVRADWFALLKQQTPAAFTKALGLSSALYSVDNPVGHARTYLNLSGTVTQDDPSTVLAALKSGAAVASTGPLLDVSANGVALGGTATAAAGAVALTVNLYSPDWVPVDEIRIVVNGVVVQTLDPMTFTPSGTDFRLRSITVNLTLPTTLDAFLVVEAGVPLTTSGDYRLGTPWNKIMRGIYPIAITNPIFVDVNGGGYTAPGL